MKAEGGALVALASSIADGEPIDWAQAEASAGDEHERELIRRLKVIASIGDVHRSADDLDEPRSKVVGRIRPSTPPPTPSSPPSSILPHTMVQEAPSPAAGGPGSQPASADATPPVRTTSERWGPLELRDRVGAGVFGEVYRAYDHQLQREVAVKLLRTGSRSADLLASKVLHEGRLLARVRHRNVVTVHGVEAHGDRVGLWMEYLRGCTLEELLDRQGAFSGREAALIGQDLCRALAAVHGAGLLHRDIKAQNVIREEGGRVVLMDFGTGLLLDNEEAVRSAPIAGTPLYLAPEVLNGRDASPASDVYSVGVLLFHLVTGTYPYAVRSLAELRDAQRKGDRKRLQDLRPDLPEGFVQVVDRAMEADPAARYQSAGAFQQGLSSALGLEDPLTASGSGFAAPLEVTAPVVRTRLSRRTLVTAAVVALVLVALGVWAWSRASVAPPVPIASVVLLPFANLSSSDDDLSQGLTLLVRDRLATLSNLRVVSYTPSPQGEQGVLDIIRTHDVGGAVDGSATWTGTQARVFARVLRAGTASPAWVRQFERPVRRAAELPREVTDEIIKALHVSVTPAEQARLSAPDSADPSVFEAYLRGRIRQRAGNAASIAAAVEQYQAAVRIDPNHAPSWAQLAQCYIQEAVSWRVRPLPEALSMARDAAERALGLDDTLAAAHEARAQVRFYGDWSFDEAREDFARAVDLNPNAGDMRQSFAMFLAARNRLPEAMQQMQSAVTLDPVAPRSQAALAMLWHYARSNNLAERAFRDVLATNPRLLSARFGLARVLLVSRRPEEALRELETIRSQSDGSLLPPAPRAAFGIAYAALGRTNDARGVAEELARQDEDRVEAASVFAALGDHDRALALLEQALDVRNPAVLFLALDQRFDAIRQQPRFVRLLHRLGTIA
jgi:tetratricopeptide (TPR) repeat protein/tRNA A-37 threonylcarbamoyl transferase component Bud32/TolB-like protein